MIVGVKNFTNLISTNNKQQIKLAIHHFNSYQCLNGDYGIRKAKYKDIRIEALGSGEATQTNFKCLGVE